MKTSQSDFLSLIQSLDFNGSTKPKNNCHPYNGNEKTKQIYHILGKSGIKSLEEKNGMLSYQCVKCEK